MCLGYDYEKTSRNYRNIIKAGKKRGYIRVYKICDFKYTGCFHGRRWKKGIRKAEHLRRRDGGWYAFLSLSAARRFLCLGENLKICYAKSSWVKRLGGYNGYGRVGIFTHLAFPDWNKGDMTIREFREMCKEGK